MLSFLEKLLGLPLFIIGKAYIILFSVVVAVCGLIGMLIAPIIFSPFYLLGFIVKTICAGYKEGYEHTELDITAKIHISE